jgi:hypothetical protein
MQTVIGEARCDLCGRPVGQYEVDWGWLCRACAHHAFDMEVERLIEDRHEEERESYRALSD